jgi:hypothetical protein
MAYFNPNYIDKQSINIQERYEVKVWCFLFNCSQKDLKSAVGKVGSSVRSVRKFLQDSED